MIGTSNSILYNYICSGETYPGGGSLLLDMPKYIQEEVSMNGYGSLLTKVPFFAETSMRFLKEVSLTTSIYHFAPGEIILYRGDMGRNLYCVRKGHVEVNGDACR